MALPAKSILVVDSYHAEYSWTNVCRRGLEENLDPGHQVTFYEMDTKRIDPSRFAERAEYIWKQIERSNPDLIVTMDDNALIYLGQRIADEGYPLVFMGVKQTSWFIFQRWLYPASCYRYSRVATLHTKPISPVQTITDEKSTYTAHDG